MGVVPSEVTQTRQIDKRAILSIIHALAYTKEPTLITQYKIVKSSLAIMFVDDYDEYKKVEEELYNALVNKRLKYVYLIYNNDDYNDFDLILISPIKLNNEQLTIISKKVDLYGSILRASYLRLAEHVGLYLTLEHSISDLVTNQCCVELLNAKTRIGFGTSLFLIILTRLVVFPAPGAP